MKKKVLFLCTGNSCRSQMGEGLLRSIKGDIYEVFSAGIKPSTVHPLAVKAMAEIGIDISHQLSKSIDVFIDDAPDLVITVCDNANETCPIFPGSVERIHKSFFDPADAQGNEQERLAVFVRVRDEIKTWIEEVL